MKTMTSTTWSKRKVLMTALLVAILGIGMGLYTAPAFAAGSYTLTGSYDALDPDQYVLDADASSTLTLYQVGTLSGPDLAIKEVLKPYMSDLMKDGKLKGWGTKAPKEETEKANWTKEWLDRATAIEGLINSNEEALKDKLKVAETTVKLGSENFTFSGLEPGLYLVSGTGQKLSTYKGVDVKGTDAYIKPVPMLVQVIGDTTITLKPEVQGPVDEITVIKTWVGDSATSRPAYIDVKLTYDGEDVTTLRLEEKNDWTATYKTDKKVDPTKWDCSEASLPTGYTISKSKGPVVDGKMRVTFTNTYNPPPEETTFELIKRVPTYVQHSSKVSTVFIFEVSGYVGSSRVFHRYVSLSFDGPGEKSLKLADIPQGLSRLVVKELDSSNYKVSGSAEKTATLDGSTYSVTFENNYDNTTQFEGGVINKYKQSGGGYKFDSREGKTR